MSSAAVIVMQEKGVAFRLDNMYCYIFHLILGILNSELYDCICLRHIKRYESERLNEFIPAMLPHFCKLPHQRK